MTQDRDRITVYSDYVCPFCYLGRRSLDRYLDRSERDLEIDWHPFDLLSGQRGPDGELEPVEERLGDEHFERARENVSRLRERYGADEMLGVDEVPGDVDSRDAQAASWYVKREHPDRWLAFDEGIFAAHWVDGRDVGDADVLAEVAEGVGLDGDEVRAAVDEEQHRERVAEAFEAASRAGVTGVPTFVYGERAASGAIPPEQIERLVEGR